MATDLHIKDSIEFIKNDEQFLGKFESKVSFSKILRKVISSLNECLQAANQISDDHRATKMKQEIEKVAKIAKLIHKEKNQKYGLKPEAKLTEEESEDVYTKLNIVIPKLILLFDIERDETENGKTSNLSDSEGKHKKHSTSESKSADRTEDKGASKSSEDSEDCSIETGSKREGCLKKFARAISMKKKRSDHLEPKSPRGKPLVV